MEQPIILIGAGHNSLVTAAYLARAGYPVRVLERRPTVGGAVHTQELWPGYQVDTCSSFHVLIHLTGIIEELGLARYGLRYQDADPFAFAPFPDGTTLRFYKNVDRTCAAIARISPRDAETYRAFVGLWSRFNEAVFGAFTAPPAPQYMFPAILKRVGRDLPKQLRLGTSDTLLQTVLKPYGALLDELFESEYVRAPLAWLAAQSGPGPDDIGGGAFLTAHTIYHTVGLTRPVGGSGMLSEALAASVRDHGGEIVTDAPVRRILVHDGRVRGVELATGERIDASIVVSGAHIQTTMLDLIASDDLPPALRRRVATLRIANGMGMTIRCATETLPRYPDAPDDVHNGMQLICPSVEYLRRARNEAASGLPPTAPALVVMTPTATDRTLAPPSKHITVIWAQYHPFDLAPGAGTWATIREREGRKLLTTLEPYAPGITDAVTETYLKSPLDLQEENGLIRGHLMHLDMALDQLFMFRPLPELANYRTPIAGLYLTGASMHPGGGVSGAPGKNTATIMLHDLATRSPRRWVRPAGLAVGGAAAALLANRRAARKRM
ncbi:MAG: NAD(P)/FAD-dependent oxidoreductase [Chloroflexota bacterium]|nr:NAD(P)/FAD-dependent oxidoreductase [Chloroflexota bacterium]